MGGGEEGGKGRVGNGTENEQDKFTVVNQFPQTSLDITNMF